VQAYIEKEDCWTIVLYKARRKKPEGTDASGKSTATTYQPSTEEEGVAGQPSPTPQESTVVTEDQDGNENPEDSDPWKYHTKNPQARYAIIAFCGDVAARKVEGIKAAYEMWVVLKQFYGGSTNV